MQLVQLKTWWRIQRRMAGFYWESYAWRLIQPVMLILNWIFYITLPLWIGFVYMIQFAYRAWINKKGTGERDVLKGKIWFFDLYRMY